MDSAACRSVVTEFFDRLSEQDVDGSLSLCAPDCVIWIAAKPAGSDAAHEGTALDLATFRGLLAGTRQVAPEGLRFSVLRTVVEDSTVAAEVESLASLTDGRTYHNRYSFFFTLTGGLIGEVREYFDTRHAHEFLLPLLQKP